ncbi:hypothetical protein CVT25_003448 [Psilocybe cyanescens]|uniref:Uncharacterized protein n=1 Tax=Psilocybe cyanescens TaxID=93625 RepID=A0A409WM23_PSICY|nr:hypothetical protein CVT25_003448 [Psilocybe cyanescens]
MSFTNINDPAGVAALLEQLKSSSAWQELTAAASEAAPTIPVASSSSSSPDYVSSQPPQSLPESSRPPDNENKLPSVPGSSVASLLSQLKPFSAGAIEPFSALPNFGYGYGETQSSLPAPRSSYVAPTPPATRLEPPEDRKNFTFRQSLPVISELSDNPSFVAAVKKMKTDQDELEHRLWADREAIYTKYQEKLKTAQTKARMIGGTISQHELNMIADAFKKEIQKFDSERALPAWDGLVSRQQLELSQIDVPTMFVTGNVEDRQRQQQVVGLLETLLGPKAAV